MWFDSVFKSRLQQNALLHIRVSNWWITFKHIMIFLLSSSSNLSSNQKWKIFDSRWEGSVVSLSAWMLKTFCSSRFPIKFFDYYYSNVDHTNPNLQGLKAFKKWAINSSVNWEFFNAKWAFSLVCFGRCSFHSWQSSREKMIDLLTSKSFPFCHNPK